MGGSRRGGARQVRGFDGVGRLRGGVGLQPWPGGLGASGGEPASGALRVPGGGGSRKREGR